MRALESNKGIAITDDKQLNNFKLKGSALKTFGFRGTSYRASKKMVFPPWRLSKRVGFTGYKILLTKSFHSSSLLDLSYLCENHFAGGVQVQGWRMTLDLIIRVA